MWNRLVGSRGSNDNADDGDRRDGGSLCERFCQFPQYLNQGGSGAFVSEPGVGIARLPGTSSGDSRLAVRTHSSSEKEHNAVSPLRRKEQQEESNLSKYLLSRNDDLDDTEGMDITFSEIGSICDICSINTRTHFALPCYHSACKVCWSRWLSNSKVCMTCATPVDKIQRYPLSVLPLTLYETESVEKASKSKSSLVMATLVVEESLERCVRSILLVKDKLGNIMEDLQTVESHLVNMTRPEPGTTITIETLTSVLAVERSSVIEQLNKYQAVFNKRKEWDAMEQETAILMRSIKDLNKVLDNSTGERGYDLPNEDVEKAIDAFEFVTAPTSLVAQWDKLKLLLEKCGPDANLMPGIVRVFSLVHASHIQGSDSTDIPMKAQTVMSVALSKKHAVEQNLVKRLLPEASITLERLRSMLS
mmetsp:Transcript_25703/g.41445  ORF Transcript_25703/g.41445 Transcript_25703/m.41445 type:complete len:419 (+) Transcript_25703:58-1314(+)